MSQQNQKNYIVVNVLWMFIFLNFQFKQTIDNDYSENNDDDDDKKTFKGSLSS